jgi:hypothetical protein
MIPVSDVGFRILNGFSLPSFLLFFSRDLFSNITNLLLVQINFELRIPLENFYLIRPQDFMWSWFRASVGGLTQSI